jgi:hypothetical protein
MSTEANEATETQSTEQTGFRGSCAISRTANGARSYQVRVVAGMTPDEVTQMVQRAFLAERLIIAGPDPMTGKPATWRLDR